MQNNNKCSLEYQKKKVFNAYFLTPTVEFPTIANGNVLMAGVLFLFFVFGGEKMTGALLILWAGWPDGRHCNDVRRVLV
jgi:hypothetical protein